MRFHRPARGAVFLSAGLVLGASTLAFGVSTGPPGQDFVRGVHIVKKISPKNSYSQKDMYVECPEGEYAIGGGADVDSAFTGTTRNYISAVALRTSQPSNGLLPVPEANSGEPTKGWQATAMETSATTLAWTLTVHVICAASGTPGQPAVSDLTLEKEFRHTEGGIPSEGDVVSYDVRVRNFGPDDAPNVVITDTPSPSLEFEGSDGDCSASGGIVTCNVGALATGAEKTINLRFTVRGSEPDLSNCATVKSDNADFAPSNNEDCAFVSF